MKTFVPHTECRNCESTNCMPVCGFCSRMCEAIFEHVEAGAERPAPLSTIDEMRLDPVARAAERLGGGPIVRERGRQFQYWMDGIRNRQVN